jgi:hypothetical protein
MSKQSGLFGAVLSVFIGFILPLFRPNSDEAKMLHILNQIFNQLRNTSGPVPGIEDGSGEFDVWISIMMTLSMDLVLLASVLAVSLKHWLWAHSSDSGKLHNPEEQARNRELYAQGSRQTVISSTFWLLPLLMVASVTCFSLGIIFSGLTFYALDINAIAWVSGFMCLPVGYMIWRQRIFTRSFLSPSLIWRVVRGWGRRILKNFSREAAPDPEVVYMGISSYLFTHTPMVPNNLSIFIQLFGCPVEHPPLRIKSLAPWSQLSSLLPSMLMKIYSQSRFSLLPALRLCLVVVGHGEPEQQRVNKEAYSTINTSNPLQNLYLHLLLFQLHATTKGTDHWQDACRVLKRLEYSEEHTLELVWLIDSIQLYTLGIKEDFTTRIVEFLRGVVMYLAKCPGDEQNGNLLRTATVMAAEWAISRQTPDNGNLPRRYILSRQEVNSHEENQEMFVLVDNQILSPSERLQRTITLYQGSQKRVSSLDFVIRTLLIPIMAIESFAAEKGKGISEAVPCVQRDDLRCSLEGLWDLWEGGFNRSDLLRFALALVVPPSSTEGGTQSSMVDLLNEYLQQINRSPARITEKAFRFIDATLEHSLTTGTTEGEWDPHLRDLRSLDPWLSLHVDSILGRRSMPDVAALGNVTTLDPRVKAIVARKRLNLYLSSNIEPEPDILALLVQFDDPVISLEAFGQGVNLLESPLTDESNGRNPGSLLPFTFAFLEQDKRSRLISHFFDPQQSTSMCQSVWIMFTEDLYPKWELLPAEWRRDIATSLVAATEWAGKGQKVLAKEIKQRHESRSSGKAKQLIGATVLSLVNYGGIEHHWKRNIPLEARDERFQKRLDACAQVYLRMFATAIEELGESAKPHTQQIVNFLVDIPDVLYNRDAIKRIQHVLGISRRM